MKSLNFECKSCKSVLLDCVESSVEALSPIMAIKENGDFEYDQKHICLNSNNDNEIKYSCSSCGEIVVDENGVVIRNNEDLVEYLKKQSYNRGE